MLPSDLWRKVSSHCYTKYGHGTDHFLTKKSTLLFLRRTHTTKARGETSQRRKWGVGHRGEAQGNPRGLGRAIPGERSCTWHRGWTVGQGAVVTYLPTARVPSLQPEADSLGEPGPDSYLHLAVLLMCWVSSCSPLLALLTRETVYSFPDPENQRQAPVNSETENQRSSLLQP